MITEYMVHAAAVSDAAFDGRSYAALGRIERERYRLRARRALEAAFDAKLRLEARLELMR